MQQSQLIHFPISTGSYESFINQITFLAGSKTSSYVCVANVHMFIEAHKSKDFAEIINNADIVTPDGLPLTWGLSLFNGIKQQRVAGMDLLPDLLNSITDKNLSVYFYGGAPSLIEQTSIFLKTKYPAVKIAGSYSPPFRTLTDSENLEIIDKINSTNANIVFVVLGCPKQEKWMGFMKNKINSCMIGIGGALPVMVGLQNRAPKWVQNMGMEWFYRLCQEPKRLFKRYATTNGLFFYLMGKAFLKNLLTSKKKSIPYNGITQVKKN